MSSQHRPSRHRGDGQLGSQPRRSSTAPPPFHQYQPERHLERQFQHEAQYQQVEYAPVYGNEYNAERATLRTAPQYQLRRTRSLREHMRSGLGRLRRTLSLRRRRRGSRPPVSRPRLLDQAEWEAAVHRAMLAAPPAPPLANPPPRPPARAARFDSVVNSAGCLENTAAQAPPPPPAIASGPSAAQRRRAKFTGDYDDLYYRTTGRDAEKDITYREPRYK